METIRPKISALREKAPAILMSVAIGLGFTALHTDQAGAAIQTPTVRSAETDARLHISDTEGYPRVSYTEKDDFGGNPNYALLAQAPSGIIRQAVPRGTKVKPIMRSESGTWRGVLVVPEKGPVTCGFIETATLNSRKIYDDPTNPCMDILLAEKDRSVNDPLNTWTTNCESFAFKCVDVTDFKLKLNTQNCDPTLVALHAAARRDATNLSHPDTPQGNYWPIRQLTSTDRAGWRVNIHGENSLTVRVDGPGWGSLDEACAEKPLPVGNATKKTSSTVAGGQPQQGTRR